MKKDTKISQHKRMAMGQPVKGYANGGAVHDDEAMDKKLVKKMVKKEAMKPGMKRGGKC